MPHLFLLQIYTEWYILIGFSYSSKSVDFSAISISFLNFFEFHFWVKKHSLVNFQDEGLFENKLIGYLIIGEIKFWNLKNKHFEKKSPKIEKHITILHFMTTFHNVALKIETSFKLQRYLSPLWKLEKSMINFKT